ncbi:MAG TPA: hypothetical protein VNK91_07290, partial [Burkholderiaceae bacterium]|nr:hypothetical protein [Burkholderiaceae bacterium]
LVIVVPASIGIALVADPLVRVVLGTKWGEAVPVIQLLSFAGVVHGILSNNAAAYVALGRPHLTTVNLITRLICLASGLLLLVLFDRVTLVSLVAAELAAGIAALFVSYPLLFVSLRISVRQYLAALWRPLTASGTMALAVAAVMGAVGQGDGFVGALARLAAGVASGLGSYALALWILWRLSGRPRSVEVELARFAMSIYRSAIGRYFVK